MKNNFIFFGKSEVKVLIILALLTTSALLLMGRENKHGSGASATEPLRTTTTDSLYRSRDYAGPPSHLRRNKVSKLPQGTVIDINTADSAKLCRVPGIGPAFSRRIIRLRERLGGFYTVLQLQEVYGIDEDKYLELRTWFRVQTPPKTYPLAQLRIDELPNHPYLSYEHKRALRRLISRHGVIRSWTTLMRDPTFTQDDSIRLSHYFTESVN